MRELFIGLISGTSMDGVDAALVALGPDSVELVDGLTQPLPDEVRDLAAALADRGDGSLAEACRLDVRLGEVFAQATMTLLRRSATQPGQVRAIGSHGQTILHCPDGSPPFTLQLADPSVIASRTGITTVADFRRRDLALGGQGAPLVPAFHDAVLRRPGRDRVVVNIGGIANATVLPCGDMPVQGFDTGPGNGLMDAWAGCHLGQSYDVAGRWAAGGRVDEDLLATLRADPFFERPPPKSTGKDYFNLAWLAGRRPDVDALKPVDVQATLCELTAASIAAEVERACPDTRDVLICGGGAHNSELMRRLAVRLPDAGVQSTAEAGIDPDWVEAMAFAWLARETLAGRPGNLPSVTGASQPAPLGGIYPA